MYAPLYDRLNADAQNAISGMNEMNAAYKKARRAAIYAVITDVLGEEWTKKEFESVGWRYYGIEMPSLDTLSKQGYISRREEEFELPMNVKESIAARSVMMTFADGTTVTDDAWYQRTYCIGDRLPDYSRYHAHGTIVKFERAPLPEFKGHRYVYRLV